MDNKQILITPCSLNAPVLFLIFNRPETTRLVFNVIKQVKPKRLYIAGDGPRHNVEGDAEKCRHSYEK